MTGEPQEAKPLRLEVEPLLCPGCHAAVPLADGDATRCPFCGTSVPLPESYRELRDSNRVAEADRARVEAAYRRLGQPPGPGLRAWAGAAKAFWGAVYIGLMFTLLLFLDLADYVAKGAALAAPHLGFDLVDLVGPWAFCVMVALVLGAVFIAPLLVVPYRQAVSLLRGQLGASLSASPPEKPGGPSRCRACGAPLSVPQGALGVRCGYCGADNLVSLPEDWVAQVRDAEATQHRQIDQVLVRESWHLRGARHKFHKRIGWAVVGGVVMVAWWHLPLGNGEKVPAPWRPAVAQSPRPVALSDGWSFTPITLRAGQAKAIALDDSLCSDHIGLKHDMCALSLVVPLHKGESFQVSSPDLPRDTKVVVTSSRNDLSWRPGFHAAKPGGETLFTAPYAGWFRVVLGTPSLKPKAILRTLTRVTSSRG